MKQLDFKVSKLMPPHAGRVSLYSYLYFRYLDVITNTICILFDIYLHAFT